MEQTMPAGKRRIAAVLATAGLACTTLVGGAAFADQAQALNANNLSKGTYAATARMIHTGKYAEPAPSCYSMSDAALSNHTVTIKSNGKGSYTAYVNMQPIHIELMGMDNFGYMGKLRYCKNDVYKAASVDENYAVTDAFNKGTKTKYPARLHFPLVNKNKGDMSLDKWGGVVKLQVFVPIMEAISQGSGTQQVYMKIDWKSLRQAAVSSGVTYAKSGKTAKVVSVDKSAKTVSIKSTAKIGGKKLKVTDVPAGAYTEANRLARVTIGKNVKTLGASAFSSCKKLKTVTFQGKNVKKIGKNTFKGIAKKATIKAPKSKLKAYKKLCKKAGAPKSVKYKAA